MVSSTDMPSPKFPPVGTKQTGGRNDPIGQRELLSTSLSNFYFPILDRDGESKRVLYYKRNDSMDIIITHAWLVSLLGTQPRRVGAAARGAAVPWKLSHIDSAEADYCLEEDVGPGHQIINVLWSPLVFKALFLFPNGYVWVLCSGRALFLSGKLVCLKPVNREVSVDPRHECSLYWGGLPPQLFI